ncbi:MAG: TetR/AcrR family transcriptional regulator [Patulibacter sp.]
MSNSPAGPPTGAGRPQLRRESIERRILASTQAVINDGVLWHQLGIRQITERAELSRTAFYEFFSSKNEVLEQLIRGVYEELALGVREVLDPMSRGYFDLTLVRPALAAVVRFAERHGYTYRALLDASGEDAALAQLWHELVAAFTEVVALSIDVARAEHPEAPRTASSRPTARALVLMTERCLIGGAPAPPGADGALIDALVNIWDRAVFGLSPAPTTAPAP